MDIKVCLLSLFLGMEIKRCPDGSIFVNQSSYARKVLSRFRMENGNAVTVPADQHQDLSLSTNQEGRVNVPYKEAVGSLLYLAMVTRPDLTYAVNSVSQYAESPKKAHWCAVKRILKYVKGTVDYGILFRRDNVYSSITAYSDADFAGDKVSRKSTSGFVLKLGEAPIAWGSQKQKTVALSTTESEYIATCETTKELIWISRFMKSLIGNFNKSSVMYVDNQSAIKLVKNPEYHIRTKHIDIKYHFIREKLEEKVFRLEYVSTEDQIADIFTKPLSKNRLERLRKIIGVVDCNTITENVNSNVNPKWEC